MKTTTVHPNNFGSYRHGFRVGWDGYIEFHDDPRYAQASDQQLEEWADHWNWRIRNAAEVEIACRLLDRRQGPNP